MSRALWIAATIAGTVLPAAARPDEWKAAIEPRPFAFPQDHAAHEDYRIEWWYYTGNLQTAAGRPFGYQLTFFRTGVVQRPANPSRWALRDLYLGHFAVSDIQEQQFHCFQRVKRRGVGWAGAATDQYRVWNGAWEVRLDGDTHVLTAADGPCGIEFRLQPGKPPVLHGDGGLSRKGPTVGNASYYYSLTRMPTTGTLTVGGTAYAVTGESWMDHEFSSSFLEAGQQGWDWLSIQLADSRELMLYQMRGRDGRPAPQSSATLVGPDGTTECLDSPHFTLVPGRRWSSPASGAAYPIQWTLRFPQRDLELEVVAAFPAQEMNTVASTGFPYWEGSIRVRGRWSGQAVAGRGYLEMTGYHAGGLRVYWGEGPSPAP